MFNKASGVDGWFVYYNTTRMVSVLTVVLHGEVDS
jgi:hypothetical protein